MLHPPARPVPVAFIDASKMLRTAGRNPAGSVAKATFDVPCWTVQSHITVTSLNWFFQ